MTQITFERTVQISSLRTSNKSIIIELDKYIPSDTKFDYREGVTYGDNVYFYTEGRKLKARFTLVVMNRTYATPSFIGDVYTDVKYIKGKFSLKNLDFKEDKVFQVQ